MKPRIVLEDVKTSGDSSRFQAEVILHYKDKIARSTLEGAATKSIDILAQATLNAIQQYFENHEFRVSKVHIMKINSHEIVVVLVDIKGRKGHVDVFQQAGIALGREDLHLAIAKATLNTLNRILGRFT